MHLFSRAALDRLLSHGPDQWEMHECDLSGEQYYFNAVSQEVFLQILSNPLNQHGWPEVVTKEVTENLHKFIANMYMTIGQTKGKTLLPLPSGSDLGEGDKQTRDKDRIHVLESAVVTWTRQIKNVALMKLKEDNDDLPYRISFNSLP